MNRKKMAYEPALVVVVKGEKRCRRVDYSSITPTLHLFYA